MKALRIPVALFVPTAYPDGHPQGFWWDRLHAALMRSAETAIDIAPIGQVELNSPAQRRQVYKRLRNHVKSLPHQQAMAWVDETVERLAEIPALNRVLSWDALRTLAAEGVSICSHSREHALLTQLTAAELKADLKESLDRIRDEMGTDAAPAVLAYPANAVNQAVSREAQRTGYLLSFGGSRGVNRLPVEKPQEVKRLPVLRYDQALYRAQLRPALSVAGGAISTIQRRLKA
jgi:peptidoglycan/xylan/chitin deacetylase (PgdA/CDA1 family)